MSPHPSSSRSVAKPQQAVPMDYSSYFAVTQQPFQFMALPPTPDQQILQADEFNTNTTPNSFDYQTFDAYNHFTSNGVPQPPTPQSTAHLSSAAQSTRSNDALDGLADLAGDQQRQGSNSDDEADMTPAQVRRKAQNRAAQRAFRERKERHVKELEAELATLKAAQSSTASENERLKLSLQKIATENEILKATSAHTSQQRAAATSPAIQETMGPMNFKPTDFYTNVLQAHEEKTPSHRIVQDAGGSKLLGAGATWDFILASEQFKRGMVDIGSVSEMLKSRAQCDGQGPVFAEADVKDAIARSVASGSDELL